MEQLLQKVVSNGNFSSKESSAALASKAFAIGWMPKSKTLMRDAASHDLQCVIVTMVV